MATATAALFLLTFGIVFISVIADPDLLQDVCVADLASGTTQSFPFSSKFFLSDHVVRNLSSLMADEL